MRTYLCLLAGCHWSLISVFRWVFRAPAPSSREVLTDITSATPVHFLSPPFRQGGSEGVLARLWLADFFSGVRKSDFIDFPELNRFTPPGKVTQKIYSEKGTSYFYYFLMLFYSYEIRVWTMIIQKASFIVFFKELHRWRFRLHPKAQLCNFYSNSIQQEQPAQQDRAWWHCRLKLNIGFN